MRGTDVSVSRHEDSFHVIGRGLPHDAEALTPAGVPPAASETASASDDVVDASGSLRASTRARIFTRSTAPRPGYEVSRRSAAADRRATPHARRCWAPRTPTANDLFDSLVRRRPVTVGDAELGAPPRGPIRPPDTAHPPRERPGSACARPKAELPQRRTATSVGTGRPPERMDAPPRPSVPSTCFAFGTWNASYACRRASSVGEGHDHARRRDPWSLLSASRP